MYALIQKFHSLINYPISDIEKDYVTVTSGQYMDIDVIYLLHATTTRNLVECLTVGGPNRYVASVNYYKNTGLCQVYNTTSGQLVDKIGAYFVIIQ